MTREREVDISVIDMPLLDTRRGKEFNGNISCSHCASGAVLCGGKWTRQHPAAPGRGNCPCEGARRKVRQAEKEGAAKFLRCRARLYAGEKQSELNPWTAQLFAQPVLLPIQAIPRKTHTADIKKYTWKRAKTVAKTKSFYYNIRCKDLRRNLNKTVWGYSTVGSAIRSQRIGQGFESPYLHQVKIIRTFW